MAISKIGSNAVDTLSSKLTLTAADGVEDNDYIMELTNAEATDGRSYGLRVKAGSTSADQSFVVQDHDASNTLFKITGDGDVNVGKGDIIFGTADKGINLGVTSNTDANTLDDYEEGTFTAAFTNFSGSATFSNAVYVKIGQMVFFTLHITGKSNTSDGDQMTVSGFPFAVLGEHPASVGMNDNEFGHAMVNTAELMYFYNLTGGSFTYDMFPHTSGYARIQGAYRIA